MPARRFTEEEEAFIARRYRSGWGANFLAEEWDCDTRTVYAVLRRQGESRRTEAEAQRVRGKRNPESYGALRKISAAEHDEILLRYMNGERAATLEKQYPVKADWIRKLCRKAGLPPQTPTGPKRRMQKDTAA